MDEKASKADWKEHKYERQEMVNRCVPYKVLKKSLCIMKSVQDYVRTMLLRRFNKHTALFAEISERSKYVLACVRTKEPIHGLSKMAICCPMVTE